MLTREQVLALSGRDLDAAVAEFVMGLRVVAHDWPCGYQPDGSGYMASWNRGRTGPFYEECGPVYAPAEHGWPPDEAGQAYVMAVDFYHADASADYAVLQRVRETWPAELCSKFRHHIECLWCRDEEEPPVGRWKMGPMTYRPGDYARAALFALTPEGEQP